MDNQRLINFLNQLLSNYFVIYVKLHRYHWFVQGKHFFHLHEKFEEMYETIADDLDKIAERILMINGKPLATMQKYLKEATLVEASADDQENELISQLCQDYEQICQEIKKKGIAFAKESGDEPTNNLLVSFQHTLEKYTWMLNAYQAYE